MTDLARLPTGSDHLPEPESEELALLLSSEVQRMLYGLLYRRRTNPPTMAELGAFAADAFGEGPSEVEHRLSELTRFFDVRPMRVQTDYRYVLSGWAQGVFSNLTGISLRRRAQVLASARCAMCGRTPLDDQVKLTVDFKVPPSWGGSSEPENLQPLCEDCAIGKRDYFQTYDPYADKIRRAISYDEPQKRIGELLRAFDREWVRTDLLSIVASAKEYQEDWQRRLRDLRFLGWEYEVQKRHNEGARVWTYYRLCRAAPWPDNIHAAIVAEERRRRQASRAATQPAEAEPES
ncbi:MAG: HNH endonuclease [Propionicimonas sp.]